MGSGFFTLTLERVRTMSTVEQAGIEVGTILYTSWGYDQTNVEFFEVIATTKAMVVLQKIGTNYSSTGDMTGTVTPNRTSRLDGPIRRKVSKCGTVRIDDCSSGWVWDGKPKRVSSYA
jgi:hypothetical protein